VDKIYKTDYARVGPFLTAFSRMLLVRQMLPFAKHIQRIHTDSFLLDCDMIVDKTIKLSNKLGEWKIEQRKSGNKIRIHNVNKIEIIEPL